MHEIRERYGAYEHLEPSPDHECVARTHRGSDIDSKNDLLPTSVDVQGHTG